MASILDQYEEESNKASIRRPNQVPGDVIGPGFIDARLDADVPIFNKKKVNFKPPDPITDLVVANNFLVIAMSSNTLLRLDLEHPDQPDEVELPRAVEDKVHKIFLDPTGRHLIVSMSSQDNYYLSRNWKKPKPIVKLKGHLIESVGWNWQNANDNTTSAILLGTSKGLIFECELSAYEDNRFFQGSMDQYLKQLFTLHGKVTGLEFDRMPSSDMNFYKYYILATTPGRLYQFIGQVSQSAEPPMFFSLFQQYESGTEHPQFIELPGDFGYSELHLFFPKFRQQATKFSWMAGPGVYYGDINMKGTAGPSSILSNAKLMSYRKNEEDKKTTPTSMVLTEFHMLVLYQESMKAICFLNEELVFDDQYPDRVGKLLGICKDAIRGTIWTYTANSVFKYKVTKEDRDVWQMYLEKNEFDLAKEFCKDNLMHLDKVLTKQAEYLFSNGKYEESAAMFARTQNSFEEIALKLIRLPQKDALKMFVQQKLSVLRPQDKTQMTMLVTWMIELYLNQLGQLKEQGQDETPQYEMIQEDFRKFLGQSKVKECVSNNRSVVYDLIASHGDVEDLVFFAVLMKDFERVIGHHIQHENYKGALEVLTKQSDVELYYKFSPLLMQYVPKETVEAWIKQGKQLDPKKLIPALVQYDHKRFSEQGNEAIRYLEFCVQKLDNKDLAIHNYLLSLYAMFKDDHLMLYLQQQGEDPESIRYDVKYALRLCAEFDHKKACVHIYSLMGLYEEAVDMALSVDVELAKQQADKPEEEDRDMRKKLWLRIARHVVEEEKDIKRAMEFLHECDRLKIEDILPFFPDFVTIDHFKDAIITSLQDYNRHIDSLKEEMKEATQSAEEIRKEIQSFRNKYAFVKAEDKCSACNYPLMSRAFYLFPCNHKFHMDCLISEVLPSLPSSQRSQVESLQRKLAEGEISNIQKIQSPPAGIKDIDVKAKLDELVASECILCGDFMIRCVDKLFVEDDEWAVVAAEWD
ncbi:vacuolar protein sorting-associated protein 18 homolog [Physella acuta]|uniref:vacuolar protein sorting-associated protein 18 homolog n=1 Tax=Physella acuta TaxID=109671 RepID=UPI0027DEA37C|nr:vacuolar protein sorting-associated protein 18 homolog [Physella acuta]XP_059179715.1 vacuolar protein sorting-associated protein 18 homolog [Physella acuta]XP_059179716.1 vacuolar protein sorting-associated protein 18 homolog [Physella acuta]XP_059179718.1 vacuolar protein sorting-associated protein 18 homolog [Physella acuta]XP_059179719.1 vacuolar protein sorting-associated protein 18 homolog [Physella acuta]XP_059179720.1 vacuolar protein sorting-associated protein 18 homolog [Physella 